MAQKIGTKNQAKKNSQKTTRKVVESSKKAATKDSKSDDLKSNTAETQTFQTSEVKTPRDSSRQKNNSKKKVTTKAAKGSELQQVSSDKTFSHAKFFEIVDTLEKRDEAIWENDLTSLQKVKASRVDSRLAKEKEFALEALLQTVEHDEVGKHIGVKKPLSQNIFSETSFTEPDIENILATHLYEAKLSGYPGWQWFVTLARVKGQTSATVSEIGLLPSRDAVLPPYSS